MAGYAMPWFMYEGDWHLCHLCHLCRPCHHDMQGRGRGSYRKVCRGTCRDTGKLHDGWSTFLDSSPPFVCNAYLLALSAKIKCSICSYQLNF